MIADRSNNDNSEAISSTDSKNENLDQFPWSLEVALSGGGHRATAYALGSLLYLVHAKLNGRVRNIASVSGASITNAFVASRCDFKHVEIDEFESVATELVSKVARRGLWSVRTTWLCIFAVITCALAASLLFAFVWWEHQSLAFDAWSAWGVFIILLIIISIVLALRGWVIGRWMATVHFPRRTPNPTDPDTTTRLRHLNHMSPHIDHVFCATDLCSGRPFYFSTAFFGRQISVVHGRAEAKSVPVQIAVRASSAFPPAIPAIRYEPSEYEPEVQFMYKPQDSMIPSCLWLTDGGAYCNLGTDWHASRQRIWPYDISWVEELRPQAHKDPEIFAAVNEVVFGRYYYGEVQLIVDAALPNFVQGLGLRTPIWEIFRYAIRTMLVMYASTLGSRIPIDLVGQCVERMKRSPSKWLLAKSSPSESANSSEHSEIGPEPTTDENLRDWGDAATKEFWERGALQVHIPYCSSVEDIYSQWERRPRMTPDSKRRRANHPDKRQKALDVLGKRLVPHEVEIVSTTFKSLHEQTLMLVVAGYLNTRETIYGAFDYCPKDIPDKEWFRKLLP
jgi:Patatin-like phospholipase